MGDCLFRLPGLEKGQNRPGDRRADLAQQVLMEFFGCFKTVKSPLGLSFVIHSKQIGGAVPQKIGCDAAGALYRSGEFHRLWCYYSFISSFLFCLSGNDLLQSPLFIDA